MFLSRSLSLSSVITSDKDWLPCRLHTTTLDVTETGLKPEVERHDDGGHALSCLSRERYRGAD